MPSPQAGQRAERRPVELALGCRDRAAGGDGARGAVKDLRFKIAAALFVFGALGATALWSAGEWAARKVDL